MSPIRSSLARRRRSSLGLALTQVKPGNYGITVPTISPRALSFAPNVTPSTYVEVDDDINGDANPPSPTTALFPPTEPPPAPTRRRLPPGKRLSQGYIPRPPNAFMLFRANFVRQKHVPGSIETNHGSLSKIIGNCWRALPLEEKRYWEVEAKKAKAAHRERYPNYRFRPVHNKNKNKDKALAVDKRKEKLPVQPGDEERCEVVAQLLLDGKKGEELAAAMRQIDMARQLSRPESVEPQQADHFAQPLPAHPQPVYLQRRPSSVPPISLPTLPFLVSPHPQPAFGANMFNPSFATAGPSSLHASRAPSPVGNISRSRALFGMRRASSVQPIPSERMWDGYDPHPYHAAYGYSAMPESWQLQPDSSPLPDVTDASIFQPGWANSFKDDTSAVSAPFDPAMGMHMNMQAFMPGPPDAQGALHVNIGPLDSFDFASAPSTATDAYTPGPFEPVDTMAMLATPPAPAVCAPQPQHAQSQAHFGAWAMGEEKSMVHVDEHAQHQHLMVPLDFDVDVSVGVEGGYVPEQYYADPGMVNMGMAHGAEMNMGMTVGGVDYGFCNAQEY
ncbi:transcription factor [Ganoderma sinense ZZ0214-1]|uniref:Transcription factor n=1 Tax=Ganoderma sinense ZZ0214-1 TaxID=1077348 RepID=A0A2G8RNE9_9APHY|nr:transcription factor [Ganoderma sinense ZZ0214-1]